MADEREETIVLQDEEEEVDTQWLLKVFSAHNCPHNCCLAHGLVSTSRACWACRSALVYACACVKLNLLHVCICAESDVRRRGEFIAHYCPSNAGGKAVSVRIDVCS